MTNFTTLIKSTADSFEQIVSEHTTDLQEIPTEDFGWINHRYSSQQFRLAHIERFEQPQFSVLHMVVFPHVWDPSPIFGFDIIASDRKATGVFFDQSPTLEDWGPMTQLEFTEPRDRPEWGTIFSPNWIACRPSFEETEVITDLACSTLRTYLSRLGQTPSPMVDQIKEAQNNYSLNQRKNEHTTRVLLKILGPDRGQYFIENILFPTI